MIIEFWKILLVGEGLVALQIWFAWRDGYLSQSQRRGKPPAFVLLEHGGIWMDCLFLTPAIAWVASHNTIGYFSPIGVFYFVISALVWSLLLVFYQRQSRKAPEAHAHDGETTVAGHLHGLYAILATWFALLYFFGGFKTMPSELDHLLMFGGLLTIPLFGSVKFSKWWPWKDGFAPAILGTLTLVVFEQIRF